MVYTIVFVLQGRKMKLYDEQLDDKSVNVKEQITEGFLQPLQGTLWILK